MALAKIVYASMTGNTEEIADIVAEAFENLDIEVEINECTQVDADEFEEADICVVATYTYDDGDLPDEIVDFYEDLQELDLWEKFTVSADLVILFTMNSANRWMTSMLLLQKQAHQKEPKMLKWTLNAEEEDIENLEAFAKELVAKI